jgi:DNA-binding response OmpR family regulator
MAERVLMIEDDQSLSAMVEEYLEPLGIHITACATAAEGLRLLGKDAFDALILDVMLPDLDGFEVCRRVRAEHDIPILMLTARGDEMDRIVGLELGADDYLPKPFNPRELLARVRAILRRRPTAGGKRERVLRFGRLEIDGGARAVRVAGEERPITSHQFDLLWALAIRAGRVMSREALMDALRGGVFEAFDRSLDVHISRIRAAIEDDPKRPRRILTVRGSGYVFAKHQDA